MFTLEKRSKECIQQFQNLEIERVQVCQIAEGVCHFETF